ncbi:MAG: dephospho-CoA kinase [Coriobacteriia bacterium]|nr:dephospho-CoA kinase [Coriobacteriia bacterium]
MYIVALTGGIGAGKTVAAGLFRERGAVVLDLDDVARRLLAPGNDVYSEVVAAFGEDLLDESGEIDRPALAARAFSCHANATLLNAIVHPAIARDVLPGLTEMGLLQNPPAIVVLVVPMLVESPVFGEIADVILAITADEEERIARAARRGMDESDIRRRVECQATDAQRRAVADHVIENNGTIDEFLHCLGEFWDGVVLRAS